MLSKGNAVDRTLRAGLAFSFLYPPIAAFSDPYSWIGYFPPFMRGFVPDEVLLHAFGVVEVLLALWLLSGWRAHIPATVMAVLLFAIVVLNQGQFPVLFRDFSIAMMAIALSVMHWPRQGDVTGQI